MSRKSKKSRGGQRTAANRRGKHEQSWQRAHAAYPATGMVLSSNPSRDVFLGEVSRIAVSAIAADREQARLRISAAANGHRNGNRNGHSIPASISPENHEANHSAAILLNGKANGHGATHIVAAKEAGEAVQSTPANKPVPPPLPTPPPLPASAAKGDDAANESVAVSGGASKPEPTIIPPDPAPARSEVPKARPKQEPAPAAAKPPAARNDEQRQVERGGGALPPIVRPRGGGGDFRETVSKGLASCRSSLVTVGIFSLMLNLLILAMPIYLFQLSDRVMTSRSMDTLIMLTAVVVGIIAVHSLLDMCRRIVLTRVATQVETTLGAPILSAATKAAQHGSAREFQAIADLQSLRNFITGPVLLNMFDAPVAPIYFLAIYLIHPQLGIIVSVAALILIGLALINQRITGVHFSRASAYSTRAAMHAEAMARNALVVNALGMIREGVLLWSRETSEALKAHVRAQDLNMMMTAFTKFARLATQITMLAWGAHLALQTELTAGTMIAASIIASRALSPVEGLIEGWRSFVQARGSYVRIQSLLASSPLNQEHLLLPRPQGRLAVERVLFVPPPSKRVILNGVDFSLDPGESIAIVGSSGAGKSTLARLLVGSLAPTSGSIRLDLMDIRNWDPRQFGETIGYLPQDVQLFPGTIKANIARMRDDVSDESIFDAAMLAGVHEMISQLPTGYETQINIDGSPLSGGQRQRVALARAFFGMPRLVVLDEPNSNLDTAGEAALAQSLAGARQRGITVVAVTQRPALLKSVDKIMLLVDGKVGAMGRRDEMLTRLSQQKGGSGAIAAA